MFRLSAAIEKRKKQKISDTQHLWQDSHGRINPSFSESSAEKRQARMYRIGKSRDSK